MRTGTLLYQHLASLTASSVHNQWLGRAGLGLFDTVQVSMDAAEDGSLDQTDVTVTVKEKNWYMLRTGATTAGKQPSLDASEFSNLRCMARGAGAYSSCACLSC